MGRGLRHCGRVLGAVWACLACALGGPGAAMAHGHGPGRCRCCGEEAAERGAAWGLYLRIDRQRLQCLNERREGSGATVFRPWEERGDRSQVRPGAAVGSGVRREEGGQQGREGIRPLGSVLGRHSWSEVWAWASQDRRRSCWRAASGGHKDDFGSGASP